MSHLKICETLFSSDVSNLYPRNYVKRPETYSWDLYFKLQTTALINLFIILTEFIFFLENLSFLICFAVSFWYKYFSTCREIVWP